MENNSKVALSALFRRAESCLWDASIEAGLPRFLELANLLFLKLLAERQGDGLWESLKQAEHKARHLNQIIIPQLQERYGARAVFSPTHIGKEEALKKILAIVDSCHWGFFQTDILGDAFEYFLRNNMVSRQNSGQYFTPRPLARIMAHLATPTLADTIYDPFCGAGGLLVEAFNSINTHGKAQDSTLPEHPLFFGKDRSPAIRAAQMNAILHWGSHHGIEQAVNTLACPVRRRYSIGLTNVPFGRDPTNAPYNPLYGKGIARKKTDVLSVLHLFQAIREGGRMVAIVPEGFLLGTERAAARRFLTTHADLRLVASLPHGVFTHTRTKTALVYLDNIHRPSRKDHFWYWDASSRPSLNALQEIHFNETADEDLARLGFTKISLEQVRQNDDVWMGKHYVRSISAPCRYPLVPLGDLVNFTSTGFAWKARQLADGGTPLFTSKTVANGLSGGAPHGLWDNTRFLKPETGIPKKHRCREGDILIVVKDKNRRSPLLGQATVANRNGVFSSELVKVEIKDPKAVLGGYLCHFFKSDNYIHEIKRFAAGSIMKHISLKDMAAIHIPLPPLAVQQEAIQEATRWEDIVRAQQKAVNFFQKKHRERLNGLWG